MLRTRRSPSPPRRRHRNSMFSPYTAVAFALGFTLALIFSSYASILSVVESRRGAEAGHADFHGRATHFFHQLQAVGQHKDNKLVAFIGVQTGFTTVSNPKYDYTARRAALRASWFPSSSQSRQDLLTSNGIMIRFIIGHSADPAAEATLAAEEEAHGDFFRLPLIEDYRSLATKTLTFLQTVSLSYDAEYILKVDDDVYLRLDRVPPAISQWRAMNAGYIGCMKTGQIFKSPSLRWFEPNANLLGTENAYFTHSWGSIYALSGETARDLAAMRDGSLRFFANEDVTLGAWMLALNVSHYDDRRLCERECTVATIATWDMPKCAGLCDAVYSLPLLHGDPQCHVDVPEGGLPLLPQVFFNDDVRSGGSGSGESSENSIESNNGGGIR